VHISSVQEYFFAISCTLYRKQNFEADFYAFCHASYKKEKASGRIVLQPEAAACRF